MHYKNLISDLEPWQDTIEIDRTQKNPQLNSYDLSRNNNVKEQCKIKTRNIQKNDSFLNNLRKYENLKSIEMCKKSHINFIQRNKKSCSNYYQLDEKQIIVKSKNLLANSNYDKFIPLKIALKDFQNKNYQKLPLKSIKFSYYDCMNLQQERNQLLKKALKNRRSASFDKYYTTIIDGNKSEKKKKKPYQRMLNSKENIKKTKTRSAARHKIYEKLNLIEDKFQKNYKQNHGSLEKKEMKCSQNHLQNEYSLSMQFVEGQQELKNNLKIHSRCQSRKLDNTSDNKKCIFTLNRMVYVGKKSNNHRKSIKKI